LQPQSPRDAHRQSARVRSLLPALAMAVLILRSGESGSRRPPTVRESAAIRLEFPPEPSCAAARVWEKEPPPQMQTGQGPCMHTCPPADCECATAYQSARLKLGERHRRLIDMNTGPGSACCRCYDQPSTPHARVVIEAEWCARRREPMSSSRNSIRLVCLVSLFSCRSL
jgi:hypothetical protein